MPLVALLWRHARTANDEARVPPRRGSGREMGRATERPAGNVGFETFVASDPGGLARRGAVDRVGEAVL
ncbi:hypothetical protein B296_00051858 [Ensete ventricosum]|uniref:Uncharacterized protein n=1 Tax=Ensete ventricosum TaxID=4639 RepID=A0A426YEZ3_ENSVE|nr:hypothetical protein B296_00051858 [Ensete ventricosum]